MASLVLSVMLWLYVQYQESTKIEFPFMVPVEVNPPPESLHLLTSKPTVAVSVWGTSDAIDDFKRRKRFELIKAYVDGRSVKQAGESNYPVVLGPSKELANVEIRERVNATLRFEEKLTLSRKVEIVPGGSLPEGFELGATDVNPPEVTISGPRSLIRGAQVQVTINLAKVQSGATIRNVPVEVRDRNGTPISPDRIELNPSQVEVTPSLTPANPRRTLLLSPAYVGQPASGFHVVRVEISPREVKVQGDRTKLSGLTVLETEPVNLSELKGKATKEVNLKVPEGVIVQGSRRVSVTIYVEPDAASANSPSHPPPGP